MYTRVAALLITIVEIGAVMVPHSADDSKCTIYVSQKQPRYVPYTETYKVRKWGLFYQTQSRVNFRVEYAIAWVTETVCCTGYENRIGNCVPICRVSCVNGRCVKPETCECYAGYKMATGQKNFCVPVCDSDCANGYCEGPNRCACDTGYRPSQDRSTCMPICAQNCERNNARCVAPDVCECSQGYRWDNSTETSVACAPICEVPCVNGKCTAPNTCTCNDGYVASADNAFSCEPKCERPCVFGHCTMPNTCTCDQGYGLNEEGICEPICDHQSCGKNACIAPENCRCEDGNELFRMLGVNCPTICSRGVCLNGVCSSNGVCTCNDGYHPAWTEDGQQLCSPFCKRSCHPFGKCIAPDTCECNEGYRPVDADSQMKSTLGCQPVCETPCGPNSVCTRPNFCECTLGYTRIEAKNGCMPICDTGCGPNATCKAPQTCACDEGYERGADFRCVPSCSACRNGTCVAPEVCRCPDGYLLTNESVCARFCENNCEHEYCATADECQLRDDFETRDGNGTKVEPCRRECKGHGVCIREEEACECFYGWSGWDCDQLTVCISFVDPGDRSLEGLAFYNETNSTLMDARYHAPYCYQCNETAGNRSFCFGTKAGDGTPTIGCFVETGSPCYSTYHGNSTATVSTMAGTLAVITILIMAAGTTAAYFALRRYRRKRIRQAIAQSALFQGSIANETLLSEECT